MQFYLDSPVTLSKIPITTKTLQKKIRLKAVLFSFDWSFYQLYSPFVKIEGNGLCKWSAGLKVMNFQTRSEPIRIFIFSCFPSIVKDELAVLQRRTAVELPAETRITFTFCWR